MLTMMICGCLAAVTWCTLAEVERVVINFSVYPIKSTRHQSPCESGYAYIPIAFVALLYLVYLVECYHCTARIQLARRIDVASVAQRVQAMRDAVPRVWWKAVCYHYVRRKRQVTRYRNGDAYTTTQVYYERVNTHSASTTFGHACCGHRDASRNLILDSRPPITKVRFSKGFAFANIEAASEFEDQRSRFFAEHERYDDFMEMREGLDLVGVSSFKEYMVAYRDADNVPWYSSQVFFWMLSCFLMSWPLRIVIECNTAYVHYTVTKIFGTNYELDHQRRLDLEAHLSELASGYGWPQTSLLTSQVAVMANCTGSAASETQSPAHTARNRITLDAPISHATTIDSLELFAAIRENCTMVPSYSEVMRLDVAARSDDRDDHDDHDDLDNHDDHDDHDHHDDHDDNASRRVRFETAESQPPKSANRTRCNSETYTYDTRPINKLSAPPPSIHSQNQSAIIGSRKNTYLHVLEENEASSSTSSSDTRLNTVKNNRNLRNTQSNYSFTQNINDINKAQNRRSWAGFVTTQETQTTQNEPTDLSLSQIESINRNLIDLERDEVYTSNLTLFFPNPLTCVHPSDPFGGKDQTTPTDDPPPYEEALTLPILRRITRSITDRGDLFEQSRAFITDTIMNRRSCMDNIVSDADAVRLLQMPNAQKDEETNV